MAVSPSGTRAGVGVSVGVKNRMTRLSHSLHYSSVTLVLTQEVRLARLALACCCLVILIAASTLPALPLSSVISLAFAPVVAAATKSALNAKRSLAGVKPSAGGQS